MDNKEKNDTLVIMAASKGFPYEGFVGEGYHTIPAYKPVNIFVRILREVCFRIPFLPKKVFYNEAVKEYRARYIYIRDAIITREYLEWLKIILPDAQINFIYENLVGKARHLHPDSIPKGIRVWTFDAGDSEKYGIRLRRVIAYFKNYVKESKAKKYDLLFVGRDKGRGDELKRMEEYLNSNGITTRFVITADGRFSKRKKYYSDYVSYDQVTDWIAESRALLNIGMENQKSVTMRDIESYFNRIKLVTTNEGIKDTEIYDPQNTFFIKDDHWDELVSFLQKEYVGDIEMTWEKHTVDDAMDEIIHGE